MFQRIRGVVHTQLSQGLSVSGCSQAMSAGLTIGIFPIMGVSTAANTAVALAFRLNQPIVQAVNWLSGPIKIVLIFPFLRLGEWVFRADPFTLSLTELSKRFYADSWGTLSEFAWTFLHVAVGWLVCAPFIYAAGYWAFRLIFGRFARKQLSDDSETE